MAGPQILIRKQAAKPAAAASNETPPTAPATTPHQERTPEAPAPAPTAPAAKEAIVPAQSSAPATPAPAPQIKPQAPAQRPAQSPAEGKVRLVELGNGKYANFSDVVAGETSIVEMLRSGEAKSGIVAALGGTGDPTKFIESAVAYVCDRSDQTSWARLALCTPESVVESVKDLAAVGLVVNAIKGTAFLTPRTANGVSVATSVPGVRGLEERICSSPQIASIESNAIRALDTFECDEGNAKQLVFKRKLGIVDPEKNPIIGAYSVIRAKDGRIHISTTSIFQKTDEVPLPGGKKAKQVRFLRQDGSELNTSRMPAEVAAAYAAQRKAMREVGRTWLHEDASTQALIQLEDRANGALASEPPTQEVKEDAAAKNAPQVRDAAPLKTAEAAGENQEPVRTGASVGV